MTCLSGWDHTRTPWQRAGTVIVIRMPGGHEESYTPAQLVRYEAAPKHRNQHYLIDGYMLVLHYDGGRVERFSLPHGDCSAQNVLPHLPLTPGRTYADAQRFQIVSSSE